MDAAKAIVSCLCGPNNPHEYRRSAYHTSLTFEEKDAYHDNPEMSPSTAETTASELAISVIAILRTADAPGEALTRRLNEEVGAEGWSDWLAEQVLHTLEATLGEGNMESWGQALKDAYDSTIKLAQEEFKKLVECKEHPLEVAAGVLLSLVAFGVLARLMPWVRLLGFGELGPVEGSFAAQWQATYAGFVPKESLFSYLYRLGMIVTN